MFEVLNVFPSIRLVFSIADIQSEPEEFADAEGEGAEEAAGDYPIRVSLSITKVKYRCYIRIVCFADDSPSPTVLVPSTSTWLPRKDSSSLRTYPSTKIPRSEPS